MGVMVVHGPSPGTGIHIGTVSLNTERVDCMSCYFFCCKNKLWSGYQTVLLLLLLFTRCSDFLQ